MREVSGSSCRGRRAGASTHTDDKRRMGLLRPLPGLLCENPNIRERNGGRADVTARER
jgi:hypothetical protein